MITTTMTIKQSSFDVNFNEEGWENIEAKQQWPENFFLKGGQHATGDYFVFAVGTLSTNIIDIAESKIFYGNGVNIEIAEENAFMRYQQNEQI